MGWAAGCGSDCGAGGRLGYLYCRPPGFTVMPPGKYSAGGLQSGCTVNLTGVQYKMPGWIFIISRGTENSGQPDWGRCLKILFIMLGKKT